MMQVIPILKKRKKKSRQNKTKKQTKQNKKADKTKQKSRQNKTTATIMLLTLSAHAREGYSSHFVCHSVCHFSILEKAPFSGLKLTSVYILGDDLSAFKYSTFLEIEAILEKKRVELRP